MIFKLSEEHQMIQKMVRDFARQEVEPTAKERDEEERFDMELFSKMAELGLTGIPWPEEYGGIGSDYLAYVIAVEELSKVCASTGVTLSAHTSLAGWPIYAFGTEEQKHEYLKPMARGEKIGAYGLTEPGSGSDAGGMKTTAVRNGDDYILNGTKIFITNGGIADIYIVFANLAPEQKHKGTTAFIVEKDFPGFSVGKKERKLGVRSSPTTEIIFQDCRVPLKTALAGKVKALKSQCRRLMEEETELPLKPSGLPRVHLRRRRRMRKSGSNSAGRSPSSRASLLNWLIWRRRLKLQGF